MKVVGSYVYFAVESVDEVPEGFRKAYESALRCLGNRNYKHNVVKVAKDLSSVSLLYYPDLNSSAHPYLRNSITVSLNSCSFKGRNESDKNPPILHRVETILSEKNERIKKLSKLTEKEEKAGMFSNPKVIGRKQGWNRICNKTGMKESLS